MDPRAFNQIFPEEINSVGEFLKNNRRNIRGSARSDDVNIRNGVEAVDVHESPRRKFKKMAPKDNHRQSNKTSNKTMKKALIEYSEDYEDDVDSYANKLDSIA